MDQVGIPPLVNALFRGMDGGAKRPGSEMSAHMPSLYVMALNCAKFGSVVDCGVGGGFSTVSLLAGVSEAGKTLTSYDINTAAERNVLNCLGIKPGEPGPKNWEFRHKDSFKAPADWADGSVSMLFLDTSHFERETRRELALWFPKIHPKGVIAGHDYLLHEYPDWKDHARVKLVVDEFVAAHKDRFHFQLLRYDCGVFVLWSK